MELISFRNQDQLIIDQAHEIAEGVFCDLMEGFEQLHAAGETKAEPHIISYFLCAYFAEVLFTTGWTVAQLQEALADVAVNLEKTLNGS